MANMQPWLGLAEPSFPSRYPEFNIPTYAPSSSVTTPAQRSAPSPASPGAHPARKNTHGLVGTHRGAILVRDPPRDRLPGTLAEPFRFDPPSVLTRFPGKSETLAPGFVDDSCSQFNHLPTPQDIAQGFNSTYPADSDMTKKRRSLQSIFIPSFLQAPLSPTSSGSSPTSSTTSFSSRMRSYSSVEPYNSYYDSTRSKSQPSSAVTSPRDSPPPEFLLDDDPFANLSASPFESSRSSTPTPAKPIEASLPPKPRSPLTPSSPEAAKAALVVTSSPRSPGGATSPRASLPRTLSSGRMQPRPAYQKPAFQSRPSLPSLNTLARMNVVVPKKIRKGRVGAGLPFEPWNNLPTGDRTSSGDSQSPQSPGEGSGPSGSQITPSSSQVTLSIPGTPVSPSVSSFLEPSHPTPQLISSPTSPTAQSPSFATQITSSPPQSLHPPSSSVRSSDSYVQAQTLMPSLPVTGLGDFVADLDIDFLDLSDDPSDEGHEQPQHHHQLSAAVQDTPTLLLFDDDAQSELPYTTDTDTSLDDFSVPSLSRSTSLELSFTSLSRSLSLTSTSSSGSESHQRPFYAVQSLVASSSEIDLLNSPPDDEHTMFAPLYSSVNMVANWRSRFEGEPFELDGALNNAAVSPLYDSGFSDKPGASVAPLQQPSPPRSEPRSSEESRKDEEIADGGGWENGRSSSHSLSRSGYGGSGSERVERGAGSRNVSGSSRGGQSGGHGGDDEDGDRRDDRRRNERSYIATPSSSEPTSSDEDEDSADEYGEPSGNPSRTRFPGASGSAGSSGDDDDDVPLAQRIPTALTAQRTIRKQVREEKEQRRKDRAARAEARSRQTTLRPAGAGGPNPQTLMSSSQEAALHASQPTRQRQRTQTLPGNNVSPFAPEDLTRKLQNVQIADASSSSSHHHRTPSTRSSKEIPDPPWSAPGRSYEKSFVQPMSPVITSPHHSHHETPPRGLRLARSFHRPERRPADDHRAVPLPHDADVKLGRSVTGARARSRTNEDSPGSRSWHLRSSHNQPTEVPVPKVPRVSEEYRRQAKATPESRSARTSFEAERPARQSTQRPPMPPIPSMDASPVAKVPVTQQRVFIGDMQRFNMVEISASTTAGDVIEMVEAQGSLAGWAGSGGWMVWEVAQDFGMERPVRSFELLSDVQASWNSAKMVNTFVIRLTPLAAPLSRSAIPSSSPTYSGYVEWEVKRGKWSKRWMQLREHSLWLSKRDNGRDEVHLCSLSNFDAYFITRQYKAPKPFTFAVKSADNLSFFENTADYLHTFSCKEEEGNKWMERILVARSYVLYQERNVLFNPKAAGGNAAETSLSRSGTSLSRSGTRKTARPLQPLVAVPPPYNPTVHVHDVFEPGSLLSKQG